MLIVIILLIKLSAVKQIYIIIVLEAVLSLIIFAKLYELEFLVETLSPHLSCSLIFNYIHFAIS